MFVSENDSRIEPFYIYTERVKAISISLDRLEEKAVGREGGWTARRFVKRSFIIIKRRLTGKVEFTTDFRLSVEQADLRLSRI